MAGLTGKSLTVLALRESWPMTHPFAFPFRSNGSGKSSLAMATLWALTGSVDPRPLQDSKVSDVVNDSCKVRPKDRTVGVK